MDKAGFPLTETRTESEGQGVPPHLFQAAVEQSPVAISITDLRANILYTNPAFHRVTGYDHDNVAGRNESLLSDKRTPPQVYRAMWLSLMEQRPWRGILINRRKDGSPYLAELNVAPVLDEQGRPTHYLGMHRDVTEIHRLQSRLGNHRQLIESVINAAPMVVALVDEEGEVVLKNPAYLTLMAELNSTEPAQLMLGSAGESFGVREIRIDSPGGEPRWFVCSATQVKERDEEADSFFVQQQHDYRLLIAKEITEIKHQQEQMRVNSLRALVSEQEKLGTLRETISAAIFQLQGPLNMLTAAVAMESRRQGERHERSTYLISALHSVIEAGNAAITVLEGSLPRLVDEPQVVLNINQVLRDALGITTERLLSGGIVIDWRPSPVLPAICGYENQLRAMFKQLIDNAIDALDGHNLKERSLMISSTLRDGEVCITIEDSGPGIAEEHLLKVFEPFFTTRNGGDHTGMGLAMVQETVNSHAGVLRLANRVEGGCRVVICLPVTSLQLCEISSQELS